MPFAERTGVVKFAQKENAAANCNVSCLKPESAFAGGKKGNHVSKNKMHGEKMPRKMEVLHFFFLGYSLSSQ